MFLQKRKKKADELRLYQENLDDHKALLEQLQHEAEVNRKYNNMIATSDSKARENEILKNLMLVQGEEEYQSNELNLQRMLLKRNKEILAEKNKLYNLH
jgi:hypothetical protein